MESTNIEAVRIAQIERAAAIFLRYGLVVAIGWIAAMKATDYEAKGIQPLIAHSPLIRWGYSIWTVDHFTMIIGVIELIIVGLIAIRPWFPKASAVGSVGAICMFLTTLSFIITWLGAEPWRVSGSFRRCRGVSHQRFGPCGRFALDAGRLLKGSPR
jgi:uncharacterized membrane protein YkgB